MTFAIPEGSATDTAQRIYVYETWHLWKKGWYLLHCLLRALKHSWRFKRVSRYNSMPTELHIKRWHLCKVAQKTAINQLAGSLKNMYIFLLWVSYPRGWRVEAVCSEVNRAKCSSLPWLGVFLQSGWEEARTEQMWPSLSQRSNPAVTRPLECLASLAGTHCTRIPAFM